jgi:hypothetical protein
MSRISAPNPHSSSWGELLPIGAWLGGAWLGLTELVVCAMVVGVAAQARQLAQETLAVLLGLGAGWVSVWCIARAIRRTASRLGDSPLHPAILTWSYAGLSGLSALAGLWLGFRGLLVAGDRPGDGWWMIGGSGLAAASSLLAWLRFRRVRRLARSV